MRKLFFWALLLGLVGLWAFSDVISPPEIVRADRATISDGDTLVLNQTTFRLFGIDAPEYSQVCKDARGLDWACGKAARAELARLAKPGGIACSSQAEDKYSRRVAKCGSAAVPDLAEAMVAAGLAISPAERGTAPYDDQQDSARAAKRGIWQGTFDDPADWRARHPRDGAPQK